MIRCGECYGKKGKKGKKRKREREKELRFTIQTNITRSDKIKNKEVVNTERKCQKTINCLRTCGLELGLVGFQHAERDDCLEGPGGHEGRGGGGTVLGQHTRHTLTGTQIACNGEGNKLEFNSGSVSYIC